MQWEIIKSILCEARDNLAIMSTGYGKSLCFQFPPVYTNKIAIVVSPLISLMEDQVHSLTVTKIKACLLGTAQKDRSIIEKIINKEFNVVYSSPEYITGDSGQYLLKQIRSDLVLIAIDEAHCISKWGHDFRSAFRYLKNIRSQCPKVPILAVTATATEPVSCDIIESLGLKNPQVLCTGFDRPNLEFILRNKSSNAWNDIGPLLKSVDNGSIIIYCISRNSTDTIAKLISEHNEECATYHAGMPIAQRKLAHQDFVNDRVRIVVATIAFGMGIDKPDVRMVIHYGISKDIESFYQEVGRAGRDGLPSKCIMFYSRSDWIAHKMVRESNNYSAKYLVQLENLTLIMAQYIQTSECRRKFILNYFGDEKASQLQIQIDCCDNCRKHIQNTKNGPMYEGLDESGKLDITKDCYHILTIINDMDGSFGLNKAILVLRGSKVQSLPQKYQKHPLHGVGISKKDEWYKEIADYLQANGFLQKKSYKTNSGFPYQTIQLSSKGADWLRSSDRSPIKIVPTQIMKKFLKPKLVSIPPPPKPPIKNEVSNSKSLLGGFGSIYSTSTSNQNIMKHLLKVRSELSRKWDVMPYAIASNTALNQMADLKPRDLTELKDFKLDGFSEAKVNNFGLAFIQCIREYLNLKPLSVANQLPEISANTTPLTVMHQKIHELWKSKNDLETIEEYTGLASSRIAVYLADLIEKGEITSEEDFTRLHVTKADLEKISNLYKVKGEQLVGSCPLGMDYIVFRYCISICRLKDAKSNSKSPNITKNELNIADTKMESKSSKLSIEGSADPSLWDDEIFDVELSQVSEIAEKQTLEKENKSALDLLRKDLEKVKEKLGKQTNGEAINNLESNQQLKKEENRPILNLPKKQATFNYESDSSVDEFNESELGLLLKDIEKEEKLDNEKNSDKNPTIKIRKKKSTFDYETDSSEEEKPAVVTQKRKRILPSWMSK